MSSVFDSTAAAVSGPVGDEVRESAADAAWDTVEAAAMTELYVATSQGSYSWFRQGAAEEADVGGGAPVTKSWLRSATLSMSEYTTVTCAPGGSDSPVTDAGRAFESEPVTMVTVRPAQMLACWNCPTRVGSSVASRPA